jgi:putative oxidoreductase
MRTDVEEVPYTRPHKVNGSESMAVSGPVAAGITPAEVEEDVEHYFESQGVTASSTGGRTERVMLGLGRAIFGGYFAYNGVNHFLNSKMLTEYARAKGTPMPAAAVAVSGALLVAGGLSLLTGTRPKIGASLISAFLLGVSPQIHNFWDVEDEQQRMAEFVNFTKNMALIGGACLAAAMPEPWPASVDAARA